jgi:hypothetical protein
VSSKTLDDNDSEVVAFRGKSFNLELSDFVFLESSLWFYYSGGGAEFFSTSQIGESVRVVNKIHRFKNHTWIGTDKGLYDDANSLMSESAAFTVQTDMEDEDDTDASLINIADITHSGNALYCVSNAGKIYRLLSGVWDRYEVTNISAVQSMVIFASGNSLYVVLASYNRLRVVDITEGSGALDVAGDHETSSLNIEFANSVYAQSIANTISTS